MLFYTALQVQAHANSIMTEVRIATCRSNLHWKAWLSGGRLSFSLWRHACPFRSWVLWMKSSVMGDDFRCWVLFAKYLCSTLWFVCDNAKWTCEYCLFVTSWSQLACAWSKAGPTVSDQFECWTESKDGDGLGREVSVSTWIWLNYIWILYELYFYVRSSHFINSSLLSLLLSSDCYVWGSHFINISLLLSSEGWKWGHQTQHWNHAHFDYSVACIVTL